MHHRAPLQETASEQTIQGTDGYDIMTSQDHKYGRLPIYSIAIDPSFIRRYQLHLSLRWSRYFFNPALPPRKLPHLRPFM